MFILKFYLKVFAILGLLVGFTTFISFSNIFSLMDKIIYGLILGIIYAAFMSIFVCTLHIITIKLLGFPLTEETIKVRHKRNTLVKLTFNQTYDLCINSLSVIRSCKITRKDKSKGIIIAKTAINLKTWSDTITFNIIAKNNATNIEIESKPPMPTAMIDWGKNLDNVEKIVAYLKKNAPLEDNYSGDI
jgi:hypothetical protein